MSLTLKYGENGQLPLEVPAGALVAEFGRPATAAVDDAGAALRAALAEPIDFPPLMSAVVPGDRVAIPLQPGLPQAANLVAALVDCLCQAGISATDISILVTPEDTSTDPKRALGSSLADQVELVVHDSTDRDALAYLASSSEKKPIYLNRVLQDADVVLPIGLLRVDSAVAYHGIHGVILPSFSDSDTIERFRAPSNEDSDVQRRRRYEEASEAAWLLGVIATIQVVPGCGDSILHVLAGSVEGVLKEGRKLCQSAWQYPVPQPAKLVVAGIEGSANCQTWENVARAVASALKAVDDDGVIAICSELSTSPGEALQHLATAENYETALHDVRRQRSADAIPASQILRALDQSRIFLLSCLDDEVVEDLGLAPVSDEDEITRLSSRFDSCIVLSNAQYAEPTTASH